MEIPHSHWEVRQVITTAEAVLVTHPRMGPCCLQAVVDRMDLSPQQMRDMSSAFDLLVRWVASAGDPYVTVTEFFRASIPLCTSLMLLVTLTN